MEDQEAAAAKAATDQASLTAATDQNGTATDDAAQPQPADPAPEQADDELATALAAFKAEVEALKTAVDGVGDRVTAIEDSHGKLEARIAALESADLPPYNDAPLAARVTALEEAHQETEATAADLSALEAKVAELGAARDAAPPDADALAKMVSDLEGRLNAVVLKLRHIL